MKTLVIAEGFSYNEFGDLPYLIHYLDMDNDDNWRHYYDSLD